MKTSLLMLVVVVIAVIAIAGCSGGGDNSSVSQSVADTWPAKWCGAQPGMAKSDLASAMGSPPTSASDTHMTWSAHQYQFNAFLGADGTVDQLDINGHSLSEADKAGLKCAMVRSRESMAAAAQPVRAVPDACTLVTQAEMSAILGAPVTIESPKKSKCIYNPTSGISPYAEFSIDVGDGAVGMAGVGMASRHEPGLSNPLDGIGDQAASAGPALFIRSGDDLITIVLSGVPDSIPVAKKIFDTAKAKM